MQRILIVEDEKRVADLLKIGLEENGYQVLVAYDGAMGLRLFQSNTFQLVISDIILPKMDGFELCREIRKIDDRVPILMLTALGTADDKLEGFDVGADDYMGETFRFQGVDGKSQGAAETECGIRRCSCETDCLRRFVHQSGTAGSHPKQHLHPAFP